MTMLGRRRPQPSALLLLRFALSLDETYDHLLFAWDCIRYFYILDLSLPLHMHAYFFVNFYRAHNS